MWCCDDMSLEGCVSSVDDNNNDEDGDNDDNGDDIVLITFIFDFFEYIYSI